jgi:hypothetical protein
MGVVSVIYKARKSVPFVRLKESSGDVNHPLCKPSPQEGNMRTRFEMLSMSQDLRLITI